MTLSSGGAVLELLIVAEPPTLDARMSTDWAEGRLQIAFTAVTRHRWYDAMQRLMIDGAGSAVLTTDDGEMELVLAMSKKDELLITARLQSPPDFMHEMRVVLELAQSDLLQLETFVKDY